MFDFWGKKKEKKHVIGSPVRGKAVPMSEVSDPTFAQEILGKGVAVIPEEGKIYAPADGSIGMVFETLHAVSLTTPYGAEILIHVGLDTVKLNGQYFEGHVTPGDVVKKGDLLLTVDLDGVNAAGYDVITPMLICNTGDFAAVAAHTGEEVSEGDTVLTVEEK